MKNNQLGTNTDQLLYLKKTEILTLFALIEQKHVFISDFVKV